MKLIQSQNLQINSLIINNCGCSEHCYSIFLYIYFQKPFENNYENIKIFYTEILIVLNTIIFSVYEIIKSYPNKDIALNIGWINVVCFGLILVLNLLIDIYQQLQKYLKCAIAKFQSLFGSKKKLENFTIFFMRIIKALQSLNQQRCNDKQIRDKIRMRSISVFPNLIII